MITPFKLFIKNNFPFIEDTYESLDNYGLLCKIVEKLNEVIEDQNNLSIEVQNFVDTLDIQDAINEKLDEMVEDGTMAQIINSDIFGSLNERVENNTENISTLTTNVGSLSDLNTDQKLSIVGAINEVYFKLNYNLGSLSNLHTETKLDAVAAINETYDLALQTSQDVGVMDDLETTYTATLVGAINEVNSKATAEKNIYSTTETVIGQWIDGKPLYRKVINFGALPNATTKSLSLTGYTIDRMTELKGFAFSDYGTFLPMPYTSYSNVAQQITLSYTGGPAGDINVGAGVDRSSLSSYIIIEYTKTTDSAPVG